MREGIEGEIRDKAKRERRATLCPPIAAGCEVWVMAMDAFSYIVAQLAAAPSTKARKLNAGSIEEG